MYERNESTSSLSKSRDIQNIFFYVVLEFPVCDKVSHVVKRSFNIFSIDRN